VSLGPKSPPARYELQAIFERQPVAGRGPALVVAPPTAAPGFDAARMLYVKRPHELESFSRSEWVDTPARMLAPLLVRALERSGAFASVADVRSAGAAGLRLDSEILSLQQEFTARPSRVRLAVRILLSEVRSGRVLGAREIEAVEEAPSDDPYGGVIAANRAVRRVLDDVVAYCGERATAEPISSGAAPRAGPRDSDSR
jgi:cholesterol transport system auxiliary component